ncbi:MAG: Uma2 family endonuclease [Pseudonocardiaceae bacterium]
MWLAFANAAPDGMEVLHTVNVRLHPGRILIPDLVVVTVPGQRLVVLDARHVALAVEITSPGNAAIDRAVKPPLYAAAGIPHYLRIELPETAAPSASAYILKRGHYLPVTHAGPGEPLHLAEPFPVTIDLAALAGATRAQRAGRPHQDSRHPGRERVRLGDTHRTYPAVVDGGEPPSRRAPHGDDRVAGEELGDRGELVQAR